MAFASAARAGDDVPAPGAPSVPAKAVASPADTAVDPQHVYTPADIEFMNGMIAHHAQALLMAG